MIAIETAAGAVGRPGLDDLPDLMTRAELSAFTAITVSTLARWAMEGQGPKMRKLGSAVRYRKSDVIAWLDAE